MFRTIPDEFENLDYFLKQCNDYFAMFQIECHISYVITSYVNFILLIIGDTGNICLLPYSDEKNLLSDMKNEYMLSNGSFDLVNWLVEYIRTKGTSVYLRI